MDWGAAIETNRETLKRIVALLFALAFLAERASTKPSLLRASVLWFLRPAEAIARDFVTGMMEDVGRSGLPAAPFLGDDGAGAMRLADSFRELAELLSQIMRYDLAQLSPSRIAGRLIGDLTRKLNNLAQASTPTLFALGSPDTS